MADALGLDYDVTRHGQVRSLEEAAAARGIPLGSTHAWPVVADERVTGTISIGGGDHGVGLTVDAKALVKALDATVADVSD